MQNIRLATASLNQIPLDWSGNASRILSALKKLSIPAESFSGSPDIVLFPELCITGYGCEDAFQSVDMTDRAFRSLERIAHEASSILPGALIFVGLPVRKDDFIYNAVAAIHNGGIHAIIPKQNLAGDGVHYEPRWFLPYRDTKPSELFYNEHRIPFGSLLLEFKGARIGLEICEDSWVVSRPALEYLKHGADIILNPSASHFAMGKQEIRRNIVLESSRSLCAVFAMVNLLGNEAGRLIYDGGTIIASNGNLLYESKRFTFQDLEINEVGIDVMMNRVQRARLFSYKEQESLRNRPNIGTEIIKIQSRQSRSAGFHLPGENGSNDGEHKPERKAGNRPIRRPLPERKEEEFLKAVTLALFDYMRKTSSHGFVISLSGGADSATCTLLVQRMVALGVLELGPRLFLKRGGISGLFDERISDDLFNDFTPDEEGILTETEIARWKSVTKAICSSILHTIYQSTDNSSEVTRSAALDIAQYAGADHHEYSITDIVAGFSAGIEKIIERKLTWENDDLSLQNIQARSRSPMAWFFANTTGSLLITTSNRSEAAVGYCTMDGDTSGGLAPIAGVSKEFIRQWLAFMEKEGDLQMGPVDALHSINVQQPTAELRPGAQTQKDEQDLMPYSLLDRIETLAIRDRKSPGDILRILTLSKEIEFDSDTLKRYIRRFFTLWSRNQWKRERYAPSFHLDDENLDPRTWYRFPILNGAYRDELLELDEID